MNVLKGHLNSSEEELAKMQSSDKHLTRYISAPDKRHMRADVKTIHMPWSVATIFSDPPLRRKRSKASHASQTEQAYTPAPLFSDRFCPRVLTDLLRIP